MINAKTTEDEEQLRFLLSPSKSEGSARTRYAAAMYFYQLGQLSDHALEIYRTLAKNDSANPVAIMQSITEANHHDKPQSHQSVQTSAPQRNPAGLE
jgi:cytoplasmic iron level regulating protein YaaA (DUF328/UPF0246 family)